VEPHVGVPLGGVVKNSVYYAACCALGLCKKRYRGAPMKALNYVRNYTSYRKVRDIVRMYESNGFEYLGNYTFLIFKYYRSGKFSYLSKSKLLNYLFKLFRSNVIVMKKSKRS